VKKNFLNGSPKKKVSSKRGGLKKSASHAVEFQKTVLPNGIRVLTEKHATSRAASCGIWVNRGTRDESPEEQGLAHFLEHLVFKRTENRNAYEISRDMEAVGGELNAFTSREYTCFVTHSLKEHVGLSLDVLSDLVCRPKFAATDIKKEKQVVVQEIHMSEDQLEDNIFDRYFEKVFAGSPLGKPILGTVDSINGMSRQKVVGFHGRQYTSANTLVSVAGNVEHDEVVSLVKKYLKMPAANPMAARAARLAPEISAFREVVKKPSEQVHILMGFPAADFRAPLRFEAYIVNTILGGGMTSRLYQTVRENSGLVYTIHSQLVTFTDTGVNLVYAGTEPKNAPEVVELTLKEIKKLRKKGMTKAELEFFKTQVLGQILLGADDIESRMNSLGVNEMVFGKYRSVDDVMNDVKGVTIDSVHEYIEKYVDLDRLGMFLMGAVPEAPTKRWLDSL
jgi:predicted Zn-dependent peptidase